MATARQKRLGHDERRQKILETTLVCLSRDGADGTSLRSVCREMGVAPSLITHFFAGWHDVLQAAHAMLIQHFATEMAIVLDAAFPSARARMDAVILRYLSNDWNGTNTIGATMAIWQLARNLPNLRPQLSKSLDDRRTLLHAALDAVVTETGAEIDVAELTDCFMLMLDGLWLELSTNPGGIQEQRATQICWYWLDMALRPAAPPALSPPHV
jgi:AcrR family transcriptional regulator